MVDLGGGRRTPFIPQNEASECALACLAMIAGYHGYDTDLISLRHRFATSLKGATLKQVIQVAEDMGFNARPLRGEIEELPHLTLPSILHWDLKHFVVLTGISSKLGRKRYHVHDPARGVLKISQEEISRHFTGVALDLLKSENFTPKQDRTKLGITQLWSSMAGFWSTMRRVLFLSVVLQFVALAMPFYLQTAIDTVFPSFDADLLAMLALGFGGLAIISFLAAWIRSLVIVALNNSLSYQVTINLFRHLVHLPLAWFEKRHVGDVISRFGSTLPISQLLSEGMIAGFIDGIMILLTLTMMYIYSQVLALIAVVALALYGVLRLGFFETLRLRSVDAITTAARENSSFIESVRGIAAIKAFGNEGNRQRIWQKTKVDAVNAQVKLGKISAGFSAMGELIVSLERVIFVYVGIKLALDAKLSIGMLFAFQAYKQQFLGTGMRLVDQSLNLKIIQVHLTRISDIALSRKEDYGKKFSFEPPDFSGGIQIKDVRFSYGVGEAEVLKGINLRIAAGEHLALVGPSGGGKTTLAKVVMGLLDPSYGQVLVGGRPASSFAKNMYRRGIGSVAQDDTLYAGSLAENIAFFDPEMDIARVVRAATLACVHQEIDAMPLRYDSLVGDMGSVLSGGQKQRVLLARALYGEPEVLIMDEGTAHLDPQTEAKVLKALSSLKMTRIIIAHRAQSVAAADRVVMIADGVARELAPPDTTIVTETAFG